MIYKLIQDISQEEKNKIHFVLYFPLFINYQIATY